MSTTVSSPTRRISAVPPIRVGPERRNSSGRRSPWVALLVVALVLAALIGYEVSSGTPTYPLTAVFAKTPGLFPGAAVNLLGVRVGTVSSVRNVGDSVVVGMRVDRADPIPQHVIASFESPTLLGQPDIELSPGYSGGPRLAPGAVIPEARTTEPVSTDQVLKDLSRTLNRLNPHAVGQLVANLATDLSGEGASLHRLITGAAGTLRLLAQKGDNLGQLNGSLAQLTGALDGQSSQIQSLITDYDTVSSVVAGHSAQLSNAIGQLTSATTDLVNLLSPNLAALEQDIGTITTAGRTIDRNIPSIDEGLSQSVRLFAAAGRSYDPTYNWLNLNNQIPPGVTGDYVAGLVRDRLAGVCRRILANHATGLTAPEITTLQSCGNPDSGFFNPILGNVAAVLNALANGQPPPSASPMSLFSQGLAEIPGIPSAASGSSSGPLSGGTTQASSSTPVSGSSTSGSPGAPPGAPTGGAAGAGPGASNGTGATCQLLIICQANSPSTSHGAQDAAYRVPSLSAPAARLLPPMPGTKHAGGAESGHHHRKPKRHRARRTPPGRPHAGQGGRR